MKKEDFIELLKRDTPNAILEFIKSKGKKRKSIDPLIFEDKCDNK